MDENDFYSMETFIQDFRVAAARVAECVRTMEKNLEDAFLAVLPELIENISKLAGEDAGSIRAAIIIERSRDANRRRREPRAAKPRPPIKKRLRVHRCRNNC